MNQEQRTERSRAHVLKAALKLFSSQGYRATSMRDIAQSAKVSTGNVYHHFKDKHAIFGELIDEYWRAIAAPDFPVNKVLASGRFPDDLEELGRATREMVTTYRRHVALIYVDVVEFEGSHIRKFYSDMWKRFENFAERHPERAHIAARLRPGLSPGAAMMIATRTFLQYFAVEIVFGVPHHYGKNTDEIVQEIAGVLRHGMLVAWPAGETTALVPPQA